MILAGITLFNPDIIGLRNNIAAIIDQVDKLICVDNGSEKICEIENDIKEKYPQIILIKNNCNVGVATALNQMFEYAEKKGYKWVLTLDQDSVCPNNIISEYKKYISEVDLGSLCPIINDRNYENRDIIQGEVAYVDKCITSASLTSVDVWRTVGGFEDELFIDFVDHDFSAKLIENNYNILRINTVKLEHEIGHGKSHNFFGMKVTVLNHSPVRKYYMTRNWIYYMKAHKKVVNVMRERFKFIFFFIKTLLYEQNRYKKLKAMCHGLKDAKIFCKNVLG